MPVLHQLLSAEAGACRDCRLLLASGDTVLLIDRGTELLLWPERLETFQAAAATPVAANLADAQARGLEQQARRHGVELIDDREWVRWVESHERVVSWR